MKLGSIEIDKPIALAPMEDVTDMAFRLICKRLGADLVRLAGDRAEVLLDREDGVQADVVLGVIGERADGAPVADEGEAFSAA